MNQLTGYHLARSLVVLASEGPGTAVSGNRLTGQ